MEVPIRAAVAADVDALSVIQARAMVASSYYDAARDEAAEARRLRERLSGYLAGTHHPRAALAERAVFVAEEAAEAVGFVAGHRSTRQGCTGELQWLFVRPDRQRRGIGRALLGAMRDWFVAQASVRVVVDAPPGNPSRGFYLRHGAAPLDGWWLVWADIGALGP